MGHKPNRMTPTAAAAFAIALMLRVLPALSEDIYIVRKHGTVVFTNRPTSLDDVISRWKPGTTHYRASYRWPNVSVRVSRRSGRYHNMIVAAARRQGLDPSLVKAVVHAESAFNPYARSCKGAMGLMQLMPATARRTGVRNPYEPVENLRGGTSYLARLLNRYNGNLILSLAAYNAGPEAVDSYRGVPPYRETRIYLRRVLALHRAYRAAGF